MSQDLQVVCLTLPVISYNVLDSIASNAMKEKVESISPEALQPLLSIVPKTSEKM